MKCAETSETAAGVELLTAAGVTSGLLPAAWFVSGWIMGSAVCVLRRRTNYTPRGIAQLTATRALTR